MLKQELANAAALFAASLAALAEDHKVVLPRERGPGGILGVHYRLNNNKYRPHQGRQEIARRLRQIERGQLTVSNGLVL